MSATQTRHTGNFFNNNNAYNRTSDSENLGSNPSSPATVKLLAVRKNLKNSGRTNRVNRTTNHSDALPNIFNELQTCPEFPRHMMGT